MKRIIVHWTAGTNEVNDVDKQHYHFIVDGDGDVVAGKYKPEDNLSTADGKYAAHTLNCNTGSIGVSMAGMLGAIESPFNAGKYPLKEKQLAATVKLVADLCKKYNIPVTDKTVLTHAEVQPNLGIKQLGKWDCTRLPFKSELIGHRACGDYIREGVVRAMKSHDAG